MSVNDGKIHSRRALLGTLGITALSAATTSTVAGGTFSPPVREAAVKTAPSFSVLAGDTTLQAGMYVETMGYYRAGDGGGAGYEIIKTAEKSGDEPVAKGLFARILPGGYVNYRMFGAKSDAKSDDGVAIKKAHVYANETGLPVLNLSGEFWLKETKLIPIQTNVTWGNTVFHIEESLNSPRQTHFEVLPRQKPLEVTLSPDMKSSFIEKLKPGTKFIPELAEYRNCLIIVKDENDRIGARFGPDHNPRGWAREEFFYVEEHGRIIGDLAWTFSDYTNLTAYPCDEGYLVIDGGTFLMSGNNPGVIGGPYHQEGITTRRSRTIVRNQWVGLEKGARDVSMTPRGGFYTFSCVFDILLENIRLIPWEKDRAGSEQDLKAGTYGIGGSRVLCGTFRNITAEGSPVHWGVFGTNLYKNFCIDSCRLNRVDVHFHGWNITIKDSEIGQKGLTLTGGGSLVIENTRVYNNQFLIFRRDYGARWDGPIRIVNSSVVLQTGSAAAIISMVPGDFNYKYPVVFGQQITVRDFVFVSAPSWNDAKYTMILLPKFSRSSEGGGRLVFPQRMEFSHISVQGRERGLQLIDLPDVSSYYIPNRKGGLVNELVRTNCALHFENIPLDDDPQVPNLRLHLPKPYEDEHALYPLVNIVNCDNLNAVLGDIQAVICISGSTIGQFTAGKDKGFRGTVLFENCRFRARVSGQSNEVFYKIQSKTGVSFSNCEVNLPSQQDQSFPERLDTVDFLKINKLLRHNHINTRLGPDVSAYLASKQIKLRKEFILMLKSHHELEEENI